jgi:hypothetical protein
VKIFPENQMENALIVGSPRLTAQPKVAATTHPQVVKLVGILNVMALVKG